MRTTTKKYNIKLFFAEPVPHLAEDGTKLISVRCRSLRGAEKEAKKYADIVAGYFPKPTHCEIEYKLKEGKTTHRLDF